MCLPANIQFARVPGRMAEVYEGGWQTGKRHGKATFTTWLTQKITWAVAVIKRYIYIYLFIYLFVYLFIYQFEIL
jgi:hypothetical protein